MVDFLGSNFEDLMPFLFPEKYTTGLFFFLSLFFLFASLEVIRNFVGFPSVSLK